MDEVKPLTLVSLEYGNKHWGSGSLSEDSLVRTSTGSIPLKEYTSQRSILHYAVRKIEEGEETRQDALDNLLQYLKTQASDVEKGSLFLVQHTKEGPRNVDYDIYILAGDSEASYMLQRIGTSIEYGDWPTRVAAGKGIDVQTVDADTYKISLDKHMGEINDYIDFEEV